MTGTLKLRPRLLVTVTLHVVVDAESQPCHAPSYPAAA